MNFTLLGLDKIIPSVFSIPRLRDDLLPVGEMPALNRLHIVDANFVKLFLNDLPHAASAAVRKCFDKAFIVGCYDRKLLYCFCVGHDVLLCTG